MPLLRSAVNGEIIVGSAVVNGRGLREGEIGHETSRDGEDACLA